MSMMIPVKPLKQAVQGLMKVVPRNPSLPILGCVRLGSEAGLLTAFGTDLDQYVHYTFDTPCAENETWVVALSHLCSWTHADPDSQLCLEASEHQLHVTRQVAGREIKSTVDTMERSDWPEFPATVKTQPVNEAFLGNLRRLVPFAAKDTSRQALAGIFLDVTHPGHRMVATDGRRLTSLNSVNLPFKDSLILPVRKFPAWNKLAGPVALGLSGTWLQLDAGPWTYHSKGVDGIYPNWRQVIPDSRGTHAIVLGEEDVGLIKKVVPTLAGSDCSQSPVRFRCSTGKVSLGGKAADQKEWTELELANSSSEGPGGMITVSRHYLLEALEAGFRAFRFEDAYSPLHATDPQGGVHVLMPLRTGGDEARTAPETKIKTAPAVPVPVSVKSQPQTRKEEAMPETNKTEASALDRLLAAFESAKLKLKEAQASLGEIAVVVKDAVREDRQRQAEIVAVRAGLHKLQAIRV